MSKVQKKKDKEKYGGFLPTVFVVLNKNSTIT